MLLGNSEILSVKIGGKNINPCNPLLKFSKCSPWSIDVIVLSDTNYWVEIWLNKEERVGWREAMVLIIPGFWCQLIDSLVVLCNMVRVKMHFNLSFG